MLDLTITGPIILSPPPPQESFSLFLYRARLQESCWGLGRDEKDFREAFGLLGYVARRSFGLGLKTVEKHVSGATELEIGERHASGTTDDGRELRLGHDWTDDGREARLEHGWTTDSRGGRLGHDWTDDGREARLGHD
ncbi:hypothetical protein BHM03_00061535 [Ensete ventricosum]|nr:hypothetical protein BHM03_00061535 [Ensete ventricosum]